jgi:hypothetical protein
MNDCVFIVQPVPQLMELLSNELLTDASHQPTAVAIDFFNRGTARPTDLKKKLEDQQQLCQASFRCAECRNKKLQSAYQA